MILSAMASLSILSQALVQPTPDYQMLIIATLKGTEKSRDEIYIFKVNYEKKNFVFE